MLNNLARKNARNAQYSKNFMYTLSHQNFENILRGICEVFCKYTKRGQTISLGSGNLICVALDKYSYIDLWPCLFENSHKNSYNFLKNDW